jgi:hypothetical protein
MRLEELKKMSAGELHVRWFNGLFPFDKASCGMCATMHGSPVRSCDHENFRDMAAGIWRNSAKKLQENVEQIYALRLFYRDLYKNPVPAECDAPQYDGKILAEAKL